MKLLRLGLSLAILVGVFAVCRPSAEEGTPKCNCWYWNSNQHGVIETKNGVEDCVVQTCTKADAD
jgi:hypothetical protein